MLSRKASEAYIEWKMAGTLIDDKEIVEELYVTFSLISDSAMRIPQFELMWKNAIEEKYRLKDIIESRYMVKNENS